jgi:glycosidase
MWGQWTSARLKQVWFQSSCLGYVIQNFLEVDPDFGSHDDLKTLAKVAHQQGVYVVLDTIINHRL